MIVAEFNLTDRLIELEFVIDETSRWSLSLKRTPDKGVSLFVVKKNVSHNRLGGGRQKFICRQCHLVDLVAEFNIICCI